MSTKPTAEDYERGRNVMQAGVEAFGPLLRQDVQLDVYHLVADLDALGVEVTEEDIDKLAKQVLQMRLDAALITLWDEGLFRFSWDDEAGGLVFTVVPEAERP